MTSKNPKEDSKKFIQNPQHQLSQYKTPPKPSTPIYKPATPNKPPTTPIKSPKPPIYAAPLSKPNSPMPPIRMSIVEKVEDELEQQERKIEKDVVDIVSVLELPDIYPEDRFQHSFKLNYRFQPHDSRDFSHKPTMYHLQKTTNIPQFSLENKIKIILNQGDIGSCVANATHQYFLITTNQHFQLSRLFHYYCGRLLAGESNLEDSGLDIRSACKIISKAGVGAIPENLWPYDTTQFATMPPISVIKSAKFFQYYTYTFIQPDLEHLKSFLVINQRPIMFGMLVYSSFMTNTVATSGQVPIPNTQTETNEGGHCTLIIGYNDTTQMFQCVNSWGVEWGAQGFFYLPYQVVGNPQICNDFVGMTFNY